MFVKILEIFKKKKEIIKMVNENDLEKYLSSLGILEDINGGKIYCRFCGRKITLKNLQILFPYKNEILASCSRLICLEKLKADK